jgi:hypothetical protein
MSERASPGPTPFTYGVTASVCHFLLFAVCFRNLSESSDAEWSLLVLVLFAAPSMAIILGVPAWLGSGVATALPILVPSSAYLGLLVALMMSGRRAKSVALVVLYLVLVAVEIVALASSAGPRWI